MDAIDNPSYFSLPSEKRKKPKNIFRKWSDPRNTATLPSQSRTPRRNLKSLLRTNSSDAQLLVLGKPRPTDIAPSYLNRQRHQSIGNVIGSHDLLQDMVHCGRVDDDGDVFLSNNAHVQYYNTSIPVHRVTGRRHSIGSFLNRDRSFATDTERSRESSVRRKFKLFNMDKAFKMEDELDMLLVSCGDSEAATRWVNYLISCFQRLSKERNIPSFRLQSVKVEDLLVSVDKCPSARVQIVVVCPLFLLKIRNVQANDTSLARIFHADKVVALMLGVEEHSDNHIRTVIPNYDNWRKMIGRDQDPNFVGDFLGVAMDIFSKSLHIQEAMNSEQQHTYFSVIPKKVKVGQNKLIVLLAEPLSDEDNVKVWIDKNKERIDIAMVKRRNPYTLQFTMPVNCLQVSALVNVIVEKNGQPLGKRPVKCESRMRELDQILKSLDNPIHFMCQSFGLNTSDREQLDSFLLSVFQKNLPPNFNLLNPCLPINKNFARNEEFPTLLHFTAKYGLEKLSWQLLESPGGEQACRIYNNSHLTPAEIAERANHTKLANVLRNYMQMTELSSVYNYLKGISEKQKSVPENNYLLPRPVSDTYIIPPAARPVDPSTIPISFTDSCHFSSNPYYTNFKPASSPTSVTSSFSPMAFENYEIPRNGRPYVPRTPPTPSSPLDKNDKKFEGYLEMSPTGKESSHFGSISSFNTNADFSENFGSFGKLDGCESVSSPDHPPSSKFGSANHLSSREKLSPDDELLEIINDFKNNVFTITEVEALVERWRNRNDVQQSFKDKQEQLNRMREEYDRIQKKTKEQMRRTTPFEKIRKFFNRKPKSSENGERHSIGSDMSVSQTRPTSNISLQSSSSASSTANSVSSGSAITLDEAHKRDKVLLEKSNLRQKNNNYVELPHPPTYLDLSLGADFSEYVQPDCKTCKSDRLSSSSSVVNETIPECVEAVLETRTVTKQQKAQCKNKREKLNGKHRSHSLRLESKKSKVKSKVKSAENLLYDREYTNIDCNKNYVEHDNENEAVNKQSSCEILCAQTIKCLADMNSESQTEESSGINFQFDRIADTGSSTQSECGSVDSKHNSSLDLSSLSLNSNCTVDENGDIKCTLKLKISEDGEIETEDAPPVSTDIQCVNICSLPEYVNVNIQNTSSLPRRYKYTVVSS